MTTNSFALGRDVLGALAHERLLLTSARATALIGTTLLLWFARQTPGNEATLLALAAAIAPVAAVCALALFTVRRQGLLDDRALFVQILVDILVLTYLLGISGGPQNPFHDAYFLPVAVAAASLPAALAWQTVLASLACYTLVQWVHLPLPGDPATIAHALRAGEWVTHVLMASLAAYFVMCVTQGLRKRIRRLSEVRERETRAECAVAIGSVASGAAHDLASPLTTISASVDELRYALQGRPDLQRWLDLMQASVVECRHTLDGLRQAARAESPRQDAMGLRTWFDTIAWRLRNMRPDADLQLEYRSELPAPWVRADLALQQSVINLLVDAAQASTGPVRLVVAWTRDKLVVTVSDCGPDAGPKAAGAGQSQYLARLAAHALGGAFRVKAAGNGSAAAEFTVPLYSLQAKEAVHDAQRRSD